ncbi:hypothetical protein HYV21_01010 [Candidatus Microgenomates bacterium]|nr:hypothetical protein [Candidatus Microgenomates bacterium]
MISLWFVGKLFALLAFAIYVAFAAVVVRQVYLMTRTLVVGAEVPIQLLAWAHLAGAILALLFVLVYL